MEQQTKRRCLCGRCFNSRKFTRKSCYKYGLKQCEGQAIVEAVNEAIFEFILKGRLIELSKELGGLAIKAQEIMKINPYLSKYLVGRFKYSLAWRNKGNGKFNYWRIKPFDRVLAAIREAATAKKITPNYYKYGSKIYKYKKSN